MSRRTIPSSRSRPISLGYEFGILLLLLTISPLLGFGIGAMRSHTLRQGNVLPLVTGVAVLVPYLLWTNIGFVFGAAWFAVGLAMVADNRAAP